jgi:hypothetical protein
MSAKSNYYTNPVSTSAMDDNKSSSSTHSKSSKITRCMQKTSHYLKSHLSRESDCCEQEHSFTNLGGKRGPIDWCDFRDEDLVILLAQDGQKMGEPDKVSPSPMHVIWAEKLEKCEDEIEELVQAGMNEVEIERRLANVVDWYADEILEMTVENEEEETWNEEDFDDSEDEENEEDEDGNATDMCGPRSVIAGARDSLEVTRFWYETGVLKMRKKKGPIRKLVGRVF